MTCHVPVLLEEVCLALEVAKGGRYLDCTFGGGGHTQAILDAHERNEVVAIDRNKMTESFARNIQTAYAGRFSYHHASFSELSDVVKGEKFNGILADLGFSSDQLAAQSGFSFEDETLDMRMDERLTLTAADIVNSYTESRLASVFKRGGATNAARLVAKRIVEKRPFDSARELGKTIAGAVPQRFVKPGRNPATVFFQALRIEVNQEFEELRALLDLAPHLMCEGGKLAIISFHSLEDKYVAKTMRSWEQGEQLPALHPDAALKSKPSLGKLHTKKAIAPGIAEIEANSRSRSALLRVFEFSKV